MIWNMLTRDANPEMLGYLPGFLSEDDPRPAREQIDANYQHGGGWRPQAGFKMDGTTLRYPGDPPFKALASTSLRNETIRFYQYSYVAIVQPDGSFEVARVD